MRAAELELDNEKLEGKMDAGQTMFQVIQDGTFTRSVADRGIVLDLGRDMEFSFLQAGPQLQSITDIGDAESIATEPVYAETSRLRMSWPAAMDLAMHVIREGIEKGNVNVPHVIEAIGEFSEAAKATAQPEEGARDAD